MTKSDGPKTAPAPRADDHPYLRCNKPVGPRSDGKGDGLCYLPARHPPPCAATPAEYADRRLR